MKKSAGILVYKKENGILKYLLVHPYGVFYDFGDKNTWSIPKGEFIDEDPFEAAVREFTEETNIDFDFNKPHIKLTPITQKSGKVVHAFAFEGDIDVDAVKSNLFEIEYPKDSGKTAWFPEIDKAKWFTNEEAKTHILPAQFDLILELENII